MLVDSLERMRVQDVYVEGRHVVSEGELIVPVESRVPAPLQNTMRIPHLTEADFAIRAPIEEGEVELTTIEFGERGMTVAGRLRAPVRGGLVGPLPPEYCYISVTGRHGQDRPPFVGVLKGLGIRSGAHGTTVAHDSHNLVIAGTSPADMLLVARTLAEQGGGFALANDGKVLATVALPLAGLMTPEPVEAVGPRVERYNELALATRHPARHPLPDPLAGRPGARRHPRGQDQRPRPRPRHQPADHAPLPGRLMSVEAPTPGPPPCVGEGSNLPVPPPPRAGDDVGEADSRAAQRVGG